MADEADRAQAQVDAFIADSLARAKTAPGPAPDIIDGVACCAECGEPIPAVRIPTLPTSWPFSVFRLLPLETRYIRCCNPLWLAV